LMGFIIANNELNIVLAGYFAKVFNNLFSKRPESVQFNQLYIF